MLNSIEQPVKTDGFAIGKATDLMDFDLAKRISEVLTKHYPGYIWGVNVSSETGMVHVRNLSLSGIWGFQIHMSKVQEDVHNKVIINAGGEILERFRVRVGKANQTELESIKTNAIGLIDPDTIGAV